MPAQGTNKEHNRQPTSPCVPWIAPSDALDDKESRVSCQQTFENSPVGSAPPRLPPRTKFLTVCLDRVVDLLAERDPARARSHPQHPPGTQAGRPLSARAGA